MSVTSRSVLRGPLVPLAVVAVALSAIGASRISQGAEERTSSTPRSVQLLHATEVAAAVTLVDWAATADYVVTAEVTGEERLAPPKSETADPADELIGRRVRMDVQEVYWKADDAVTALPDTFTMNALGWLPRAGGEVELSMEHATRFEVGRTYLMAVAWKRAECGDGEKIPASWTVIGSGGALPADSGVLGDGEFEGVEVSPGSKRLDKPGPSSVTAEFAGKRANAVVRGMEGLNVKRNHVFRQMGGSCR